MEMLSVLPIQPTRTYKTASFAVPAPAAQVPCPASCHATSICLRTRPSAAFCAPARRRPISPRTLLDSVVETASMPGAARIEAGRVAPTDAITRSADISKGPPGGGVGGKKNPMELDSGKGGGVAVITRPRVDKKTERKSKTEKEPSWRVLLHNDDVHTFDYVTGSIVKVVRTVSRKKAHRITMQAHSSGVATVTTTWKALAEDYCKGLQMQGLTSSIAPDSSFKQ